MKIIIILLAVVMTATLFIGCGDTDTSDSTFTVSAIQDDPLAFSGIITIIGEVTTQQQGTFGIEDIHRRPCCSSFVLIVEYNGTMPQIGDTVHVTGSWHEAPDELIFLATSVSVK